MNCVMAITWAYLVWHFLVNIDEEKIGRESGAGRHLAGSGAGVAGGVSAEWTQWSLIVVFSLFFPFFIGWVSISVECNMSFQ